MANDARHEDATHGRHAQAANEGRDREGEGMTDKDTNGQIARDGEGYVMDLLDRAYLALCKLRFVRESIVWGDAHETLGRKGVADGLAAILEECADTFAELIDAS